MPEEKVLIIWSWEDVETLHPSWNKEQCQEALEKNGKYLRDRSIEIGWQILEDLVGRD